MAKMPQKLKQNLKRMNVLYEGFHNGHRKPDPEEQEQKSWENLNEAKSNNQILEGQLIGVEKHPINENNDKGTFAVIQYDNLRGFVPMEEFPAKKKRQLIEYVGNPISFEVLSANQDQDNFFIASRKQALERMQDYFDNEVENNVVVSAAVTTVNDKFVRVNIGGYDVGLPISDMGFGWIYDIEKLVSRGDIIDVMVLDKGNKGERPTISRKAVLKNPFPECLERYQEGNDYLGTVTGFVDQGVFVNLEQGVDTIGNAKYVDDMGIGDQVVIRVTEIRKNKSNSKNIPPEKQYQIKSNVIRKA